MRPIVRVAVTTLACVCALLALWIRAENAIGVTYAVPGEADTWGSYDPDSLYHARRVARAIENDGWVAAHDPLIGHPHPAGSLGAPIPWPPAYDLLLAAFARGAPPDLATLFADSAGVEEERVLDLGERARIERFVATVPMVCGTLAAFLAALWAAGLAHRLASEDRRGLAAISAALVAGVTVAATFGHVRYSHLGNGDHHAFVSLLHLLLLGLTSSALTREHTAQPVRNALRGGVAGVVAGVLITTWTASILWVALVQLALLLRLVLPFPNTALAPGSGAAGLPLFATSFHKTALLVVVPGVVDSPFTDLTPFSIVDLSWFHLAWLAAGWLIFAPYALAPRMVTGRRLAMTVPALFVVLLVGFATDAPARLAEAFSWAGATNVFMGSINESQPLIGVGGSFAKLVKYAGIGVLLGPLAWLVALSRTARSPELLPWVTVLPVVLLLTALQRRFAEAAVGPLAVVLGVFAALWAVDILMRRGKPAPGMSAGFVLVLGALALAAHPWTVRNTWSRKTLRQSSGERFVTVTDVARKQRVLAEVLNGLAPAIASGPGSATDSPEGILAEWDLGHAIEWRARRPSIATNFGPYVGEDSFLAPWRFFAETDAGRAEEFLLERGIGTVIIDPTTPARRPTIAAALGDPSLLGAGWSETMAARMLVDGVAADGAAATPGFLRLSRQVNSPRSGTVRVFEVVRGARIRATARSLDVVVTLAGEDGSSFTWRGAARAARTEDGDGERAPIVVRCPYAMPGGGTGTAPAPLANAPRGAVQVVALEVFVDGAVTSVQLSTHAVDEGATVDVAR